MPYDFKEKAAGGEREQKIIELTRYMMHKHYCENDEEALIERFADPFVWFGTAEHEYAQGLRPWRGFSASFPVRLSGAIFPMNSIRPRRLDRMSFSAQAGCGSPRIRTPRHISGFISG